MYVYIVLSDRSTQMTDSVVDNIIECVKNGRNVLIHAPGGTGKTYILTKAALKCASLGYNVACVAPTGIAAVNLTAKDEDTEIAISGSTINSWAGIGLGDAHFDKLLERVLKW